MNIKVNLADGTPAQFKTEIIDGNLVVTVVEEKQEEVNLFPKWEELGSFHGHWINSDSTINSLTHNSVNSVIGNSNLFTTSELAKASLATARVSQTYRRYRELVGEFEDNSILKDYGILRMVFRNMAEWNSFYIANKGDLELIFNVATTVQL